MEGVVFFSKENRDENRHSLCSHRMPGPLGRAKSIHRGDACFGQQQATMGLFTHVRNRQAWCLQHIRNAIGVPNDGGHSERSSQSPFEA